MLTRTLLCGAAILSLSACSDTFRRLEEVGKPPAFKNMEYVDPDPRKHTAGTSLAALLGPEAQAAAIADKLQAASRAATRNSLWQSDSKTFFSDSRAKQVGDIVTVMIRVNDKAELENTTERTRENTNNTAAPALLGSLAGKVLPTPNAAGNIIDLTSNTEYTGEGTVEREEQIETEIAAMIIKKLPNGNFYIRGSQEVRVNYDLREITVEGIVRPGDISAGNSVALAQIAEARVNYGGRGQVMDAQQPRLGTQLVDILSPF